MLNGPTVNVLDTQEEEGYPSQEIFTEEKYAYLYYRSLILLKSLFEKGVCHGQINANNLRICADYTLDLANFELSLATCAGKDDPQALRGFAKKGANDEETKDKFEIGKEDLIRRDWIDLVHTVYFPR